MSAHRKMDITPAQFAELVKDGRITLGDGNGRSVTVLPVSKLITGIKLFWSVVSVIVSVFAGYTGVVLQAQSYVNRIEGRLDEISRGQGDRWSCAMQIESQAKLRRQNPTVSWLDAEDLRAIQARELARLKGGGI